MPHWSRSHSVYACGLMLLLLLLYARPAAADRPFSRSYPLVEGAAGVRFNALLQDAAGYLWAGTDAGLFRFNGESFVQVGDSSGTPVTAVAAFGGTIWAGYKDGRIARISEGAVTALPPPAGHHAAITGLYPIHGSAVVAATENGILFAGSTQQRIAGTDNGLPDNFIYSIQPLGTHRALVASDLGLSDVELRSGRLLITNTASREGLPDVILRVVRRSEGTPYFWLGTQQGGVALYDATSRQVRVPDPGAVWKWGQVNDILPMRGGQAWAVTQTGYLLHLRLSSAGGLRITAHHFAGRTLNRLLLDKGGNLWCATDRDLLRLSQPYAGYIALPPPYALRHVNALACDRDGSLWIAQEQELYHVSTTDSAAWLERVDRLPGAITSLYEDKFSTLWIGTLGKGLWRRGHDGRPASSSGLSGLEEESILSIAGTDSALWVAGLTGVRQLSYPSDGGQEELMHHTSATGIGSDYVYQIWPDRHQRIWMATDGAGVSRYDGGSYTNWNKRTGFGSDVAYSITEDAAGDIWSSTLEKSLFRFHDGKWTSFGREKGLIDPNISALRTTAGGTVVAVHSQGVDQWFPHSRQFRHYSRRFGFDMDSTSAVLNCIAGDDRGNVYVPFERGVMVLKNEGGAFDIRPGVAISRIGLFMHTLDPGITSLRHDQNYLGFYFDGINLCNPGRLQFRYMLEGFDSHWTSTRDRSVTFPNLPPGHYRFRLQASMSDDFEGAQEAGWSFRIIPPFWRRAPFIVLMIIVLVLGAYAFIRMRDRRQNTLLKLREERLAFEYEHLKSQVNPHFLFNSLNTLTGIIEEGAVDRALTYTEQLSDLYRNMLTFKNQDLIPLAEEWSVLSAYLYIQQSRFEDALRVVVDIPGDVLKTRRIVPMALQLLVENAIKHNVVSRSMPLTITITATGEEITISNPLQPKVSREKGAGLGLENIRRRYELLTRRRISFGQKQGRFIVTLPLL